MSAIKTYEQIDHADKELSFGISRMEEIYENRQGQPDAPHRHNYYTVVLIKKARGLHKIDFHQYELKDSQIYFVSPGQVHQIIEEYRSEGYAILFSQKFLLENNIPGRFIDNLKLFQLYGESPPMNLEPDELGALTDYAEEMIAVEQWMGNYKTEALGALLQLLLIRCNNLCSLPERNTQSMEAGNVLLRGFKDLLEENFKEWHSAKEYAAALHITSDHLSKVLKSLTGRSTKEHIQGRITTAAKRMLYFSELSTKEIGYELGFSEPANFSAFFKKCTGESPSAYRSERP